MKETATYISIFVALICLIIQPISNGQLHAQITLDASSYNSLVNTNTDVTVISYRDADPIISLIEQTGEDQIWDLSLFVDQDSVSTTGTVEFFNSFDGKPGADQPHFSEANVMTETDFEFSFETNGTVIEGTQNVYNYSSLADTALIDYGYLSRNSISSTEIILQNSPAKIDYPFPLQYQTSWDYEYTANNSQSGDTDFSVDAEVDGYGQVKIGNEMIPVLRVIETQTNENSGLVFTNINVRFIDASGYEIANASVDLDVFSQSGDYERASANIQLILSDDLITVSSETSPDVPTSIGLDQNYPNPFNPSTHITYQLNEPGNVSLTVYSLTGERVQTLINEEFKQAGSYTVPFEASNLASGIYMYRLRAGDQIFTRKMTLLK